jgi:hypothetical protein
MATRKAICLVSGLFEEVNTPTDKLDFAGNSTTDLSEGTNLYYTDARARGAISVSTSGTGYGSLSYSSATGIITFSVVTNANIRGALSIAAGSGLTYNSSTGVFGTSAIPNSQLANSSVTLGTTSVSLGGTASTIGGLTSLSSTTLIAGGAAGAANTIQLDSTGIVFEGATADAFETTLTVTDPTADRTITLPDATGTVALLSSISVTNSGTGYGSISYNSATGVLTYNVVTNANIRGALTASTTGTGYGSLTYNSSTGNYDFAVVTDANIRGAFSVAAGSGLTYNSSTGVFGTSAIPNAQLANSSITIGSTSVALGSTAATISGLTSLQSTSLLVGDGTVATPGLRFNRNASTGIYRIGSNVLGIATNGTHGVALDATQRLISGHTSAINLGTVGSPYTPRLQVIGTAAADSDLTLLNYGSTNAQLHLGRSGSSTIGTNTAITSGFSLGCVSFDGTDGTNWQASAAIFGTAEGTIGTGIVPGRLEFYTENATGVLTERFRIDSSNNFTFFGNPELRLNNAANTFRTTLTTAGATANRTITFPDLTGTVLLSTSTLPSTFSDSTFRVQDNGDATKQLAFECSGISTSTTRTMTVPNENGTISTQDFATAIAVALG